MYKSNKYIAHTQITLVPGLAKAILNKKKVKEFEFYGFLKTSERSGCVKDYDLVILEFEAQLSRKTVTRRLQALQSLGWIDIIGNNIYIRSLRKVCETVDCDYNENAPRKKKFTSSKIYTIKQLLCAESLRENIKSQEKQAIKNASKIQTRSIKTLGVRGIKTWLLTNPEELKEHSQFLRSLEVTASRDKCAEIWGCSKIEASRIIKALERNKILSDRKRAGKIGEGNEMRARELREAYDDPTIFHKKGKIFKKLNNQLTFLTRNLETGELIPDSILKQGCEDYCPKFLFKLDMMYTSYISKFSLGIKF